MKLMCPEEVFSVCVCVCVSVFLARRKPSVLYIAITLLFLLVTVIAEMMVAGGLVAAEEERRRGVGTGSREM